MAGSSEARLITAKTWKRFGRPVKSYMVRAVMFTVSMEST